MPSTRFPWWIPLGAIVLALGYLPSLSAPFDFTDDGNLVYPAAAGTTLTQHAEIWWDKVRANVEHLGPFRPTLWIHWEVTANVLGADPVAWRVVRLVWCGFAAAALLWLLRELNLAPTAALIAAAAAMWNPYRNEIWTSLTLSEGVAMPYALLALVAARKATTSAKAWPWDVLSVACVLMCLGCKNTFVAIVPAQMALRLFPDGMTLLEGWRTNRWRAATYLLPLALPAAHFVYFKLNWHPGQYETPGPSVDQFGRFASWMKGAAGLDFLGVGIACVLGALAWNRVNVREFLALNRAAVMVGGLLLAAGSAVYLPLPMMAARYTMPAIWGFDVLLALTLTAFLSLPLAWPKRVAGVAIAVGMVVMVVANVGRQEKVAARSRMLWDAVHEVERAVPAGAGIAWVSGETGPGSLNVEEGIHFRWHLLARGRGDVRIKLVDENDQPIARVELPVFDGPTDYRITGAAFEGSKSWEPVQVAEVKYAFGRKQYGCRIETAKRPGAGVLVIDGPTAEFMRAAFASPGSEQQLLKKLTEPPAIRVPNPTAFLTGKSVSDE